MICDVILSKENNKYVAKVKDWPEVIVKESTRDEAINRVKSQLLDYLTNKVEIVQIEVPLPTKTGNPWLDKFGWFKNDPTFNDLQVEIDKYRKEIDQEMGQ
jgi:predicted RNase H-like HicB family nuclease